MINTKKENIMLRVFANIRKLSHQSYSRGFTILAQATIKKNYVNL